MVFHLSGRSNRLWILFQSWIWMNGWYGSKQHHFSFHNENLPIQGKVQFSSSFLLLPHDLHYVQMMTMYIKIRLDSWKPQRTRNDSIDWRQSKAFKLWCSVVMFVNISINNKCVVIKFSADYFLPRSSVVLFVSISKTRNWR